MIHYLDGNAVEPIGDDKKIIAHVCNNIGAWGAGFVMAISKKWKEPEREYKSLSPNNRKLGSTQFVGVEDDIVVANMIGQEGIYRNDMGLIPVRYAAIELCLTDVAAWAQSANATIHMPRIGCGLAGGRWSIMEKVIEAAVGDIDVYIYDFDDTSDKNYVKPNLN
jgi:O-acetyl-ADP-ribose deacetylase (regulator of RNase III)